VCFLDAASLIQLLLPVPLREQGQGFFMPHRIT
jgi:hypothetical protein